MIKDLDLNRINSYINSVEQLEINQIASIRQKEQLEHQIETLIKSKNIASENLDIAVNAVAVLRLISDDAVQHSYKFIQDSVNSTLERIFSKSTRKIQLKEGTFRNQYPQLEIELYVEGGKTRSLKSDSGHGLMQIISLLCVLSLIVITGSRRLVVLDEVLSGLSAKSRMIICEVLWAFTEIGFQFLLNEHGLIPEKSYVVHLETSNAISSIKETYIAESGTYLDGRLLEEELNTKVEE